MQLFRNTKDINNPSTPIARAQQSKYIVAWKEKNFYNR